MTDEELSELAECLEDACRGRILAGFHDRRTVYGVRSCCPLGAAVFAVDGSNYPNPKCAAQILGIPEQIGWSIARGFDGDEPSRQMHDQRAFDLGRLFREQAYR